MFLRVGAAAGGSGGSDMQVGDVLTWDAAAIIGTTPDDGTITDTDPSW